MMMIKMPMRLYGTLTCIVLLVLVVLVVLLILVVYHEYY
jgi:hypothetical protein